MNPCAYVGMVSVYLHQSRRIGGGISLLCVSCSVSCSVYSSTSLLTQVVIPRFAEVMLSRLRETKSLVLRVCGKYIDLGMEQRSMALYSLALSIPQGYRPLKKGPWQRRLAVGSTFSRVLPLPFPTNKHH